STTRMRGVAINGVSPQCVLRYAECRERGMHLACPLLARKPKLYRRTGSDAPPNRRITIHTRSFLERISVRIDHPQILLSRPQYAIISPCLLFYEERSPRKGPGASSWMSTGWAMNSSCPTACNGILSR